MPVVRAEIRWLRTRHPNPGREKLRVLLQPRCGCHHRRLKLLMSIQSRNVPFSSCLAVFHQEVATSFPGMVERGLVSGSFEASLPGLLDSGMNAFLVIKSNGRLTVRGHSVQQGPPLVEDGNDAIKTLTDDDLAVSHCIACSPVLNLVLAVFELQGEILRERAGMVQHRINSSC